MKFKYFDLSVIVGIAIYMVYYAVISYFGNYPLIIDNHSNNTITIEQHENKLRFHAEEVDKVFLMISMDESFSIEGKLMAGCKYTTDYSLIQQLLRNMDLKMTGGDICTVSSMIVMESKGYVIFKSEIALDEFSKGIQSSDYGWCEFTKIDSVMYCISKFNDYPYPIIVFK